MVAYSLNGKRDLIFQAVADMYTEVATQPRKVFHFPTGRQACLFVGYPKAQLDLVPETAVESFAGVGYPFAAGAIHAGETVLDIGSGSGTDLLIAAALVGFWGKVWGLDLTPAMLDKARANAAKQGAVHVELFAGNAEEISLPHGTMDVVTSNGVLNLVPDKPRAFAEIVRVLRHGGRIQLSDIVLQRPILPQSRNNPQLWAECIVGAVPEEEYLDLLRTAGFEDVTVLTRLDYFSKSAEPETREVAAAYGAVSITLTGRKP